ncbi:asparagine synthase (glutamine-hydrolyzing) [Oceanobacillus saliphilus]|uniref:asparagine synthase (glutamine-hydrolyzing) n=1 Tax=Oceanobacillus saliphilus TaxID=2925834 RepID=UPI00201D61C1|nr:asparagine synthase (glutamine-hydrolyzing) [Oceanobacillus saliphilus]
MCGFLGVLLNKGAKFSEEHVKAIREANNLLKHRGPDDEGYYHDSHIALTFRRLSIIDMEGGHQPFNFGDNRYRMVFNGEIYNYMQIKEQLMEKGYTFHTNSDTEVAANLFLDKGTEVFSLLRGMFAIAIWDVQERKLYGGRDRFGIKPFYYVENENEMMFASEKKSMSSLNQMESLNLVAIQHYMSFQYVPEPLTMTETVKKLPAGHYFIKEWGTPLKSKPYFHARLNAEHGNETQIVRRVREVMLDSVQMHLQSDVPVGSFLSGGIDSTLIVGMAKQFHPTIKTFSVGFEELGWSEIDAAKRSADELGVENISYVISAEEFVQNLPKIMWHMDDPLADPACVPLYFVAREASKHVSVVLSGEGADELFGGYNIYREPQSLKYFNHMPKWLLQAINRIAAVLPEGMKGKSFLERGTTPLSARYIGNAKIFEEEQKMKLLKNYSHTHTYQSLTKDIYSRVKNSDPVEKMQYIDMHTWLPGDILLKADKMTMAHSLELRVPFLDKEVFEVASKIPVAYKIANGTTKSILRKAANGFVPAHVQNKKKLGFPVPIKNWLRGSLYSWARELILTSETDYILEKSVILDLLDRHAAGKRDYSRKIWNVLMFMLWHQIYVEKVYVFGETVDNDNGINSNSAI